MRRMGGDVTMMGCSFFCRDFVSASWVWTRIDSFPQSIYAFSSKPRKKFDVFAMFDVDGN